MFLKKVTVFAGLLCVLVSGSAHAYRLIETWHETFDVDKEVVLMLSNKIGSIEIEGWDRREIDVQAEIRIKAPSKDKAKRICREIVFEVEREGTAFLINADLPRVRQDAFWGGNTSIVIQYSIKVPHNTDLDVEVVNGDIDTRGTEGLFRLRAVNGSITHSSLGGEGSAQTTNGGVECSIEDFPAGGELELKAVNGGLELKLPSGIGAEFEARAVNGSVKVGFPLREITKKKRSSAAGVIGDGEGKIDLKTVNGHVRIDPL